MGEKSNGFVIGGLVGICSTILYGGCGCIRPGSKEWGPGTMVSSTREIVEGLCEHFDVEVIDDTSPQTKSAVSEAPVTDDVIRRAAVPPRIKSTAPPPPQVDSAIDGEIVGFDGELTEAERRELLAAMNSTEASEPTGKPTNPFAGNFGNAPATTVPRKNNRPVSAFDDPDAFRVVSDTPDRKW